MTTRFNPANVTTTYAAIASLNANMNTVANLFDLCVFRDGSTPNSMLANFDMNHFTIQNLADGVNVTDAATVGQVQNAKLGNLNSIVTIDMGTSSVPALWLKTNLTSAWPGLLIENTSRNANGQTQVFWKRWDALGNPLVWQWALDVDNNSGFKGLFNCEAIDITGPGVISTPLSCARTGEVGVGTIPTAGTILTINGAFVSKVYTVATLPAAGVVGRRAFVSDANSTVFASIVAGSGTNKLPVYDDGTNWRIG